MKYLWTVLLIFGFNLTSQAQSNEIQQLLLNVEKLTQLKSILSDMKKGYQIVSKGYNSVKQITEGNFSLHDAFLSRLIAVNPAIKNYKRVADIISYQKDIVKEYQQAFNRFNSSQVFNKNELQYLEQVYKGLFHQSLQNIDDLTTIITATKLRMGDDERLKIIDRIYEDTTDKLQFLKSFNRKTYVLMQQRNREKDEMKQLQNLYQLNK
ncbi:TerB family tellurite resistance protein [Pedobacter cryophilus]|uniref:TerB family tellurite resistance protein n=1 Tax=Pedobacter cryophilus TaxID=2571271 RepID=A0A4U1C228_9SPHI|nr:TerB family tellurite resistance protein [Pedobacter cryophilus]TKB99165.1 TerB family tellurite resistance protein [Pedobacter cryophilus]